MCTKFCCENINPARNWLKTAKVPYFVQRLELANLASAPEIEELKKSWKEMAQDAKAIRPGELHEMIEERIALFSIGASSNWAQFQQNIS
jgi:hypothetical protein